MDNDTAELMMGSIMSRTVSLIASVVVMTTSACVPAATSATPDRTHQSGSSRSPNLKISAPITKSGNISSQPAGTHIVIDKGVFHKTKWRLSAWISTGDNGPYGQLCMELDFPGSHGGLPAGACGFDRSDGFWLSGIFPDGSDFLGGPISLKTATVRLLPASKVAAVPLPSRAGLPRGKFWVYLDPTHASESDAFNPSPLDLRGNPTPFQKF